MTLMPVSNICARGSSSSNGGGSRWMSQRSSTAPMSSVSSGSPMTLNTWPSTASPTGTVMPRPVLRTTAPRTRPSVGFRQMQRTRPSPICCATSAVTVTFSPSSSRSISTAMLISGKRVRRELDVDDGPGDRDDPAFGQRLGPFVCEVPRLRSGRHSLFLLRALAQRFGATDDLHDLGRDRSWRARFITRVSVFVSSSAFSVAAAIARWRAVCSLAAASSIAEKIGLDVAGDELLEEILRVGLELVSRRSKTSRSRFAGRCRRAPSSATPPGPIGSGRSWRISTTWVPAERYRVETTSTWSTSPAWNGASPRSATARASSNVGRSDIPMNECSTSRPRKRK